MEAVKQNAGKAQLKHQHNGQRDQRDRGAERSDQACDHRIEQGKTPETDRLGGKDRKRLAVKIKNTANRGFCSGGRGRCGRSILITLLRTLIPVDRRNNDRRGSLLRLGNSGRGGLDRRIDRFGRLFGYGSGRTADGAEFCIIWQRSAALLTVTHKTYLQSFSLS